KYLPKFNLEIELDGSEVALIENIRKETIRGFSYFSIPDINPKILIPIDENIRTDILESLSLFEVFTIKFISENFTDTLMIEVKRTDSGSEKENKFWNEKFVISI